MTVYYLQYLHKYYSDQYRAIRIPDEIFLPGRLCEIAYNLRTYNLYHNTNLLPNYANTAVEISDYTFNILFPQIIGYLYLFQIFKKHEN